MKIPHFYKARSRLGLINNPYRTDSLNVGVEQAPDYLLSQDFLKNFPGSPVDFFNFPEPEQIDKLKYGGAIAESSTAFTGLIQNTLKEDEVQVVLGGDHSITLSTATALLKRIEPDQVGYLQFDSHGDINTFASSPSGNFHGIYLRALLEEVDNNEINRIAKRKLKAANVMYIGNLDLDPDEKALIKKNKIRIISRKDLLTNKPLVMTEIRNFILRFSHLHVSFDVDIFDKKVLTATGIPCENGFFPADTHPLLRLIAKNAKNLSLDLVEINPKKVGGVQALNLGREIIKLLLNK